MPLKTTTSEMIAFELWFELKIAIGELNLRYDLLTHNTTIVFALNDNEN